MISKKSKETIENLLLDLEKRVEAGILERNNLNFIKKLLEKAEDENEAITICKLGTTYNKTGLVYEKKLEISNDYLPVFVKNKKLSFDNGGVKHKLIIGDNYDALLNLLVEYRNKIDIIYIDPPYGSNSIGEFAKTNYNNEINRDNLLSMMYPRLILAKQLMSKEGIILCSIDDKNQAYLKCLFDDVFGESNFIANFVRNTSNSHSGTNHTITSQVDYVLFYCKDNSFKENFIQVKKKEYDFPFEDFNGKYKLSPLIRQGNHATDVSRPNCYYPIYVSKDLSNFSLSKKEGYLEILPPKINEKTNKRWGWANKWNYDVYDKNFNFNKESEKTKTNINLLVAKKNEQGDVEIFRKHYEWDNSDSKKTYTTSAFGNIIEDCLNIKGTNLLKDIFEEKIFDNPKPIELIKNLISTTFVNASNILDFFAGSGTSGHAVLDWNRENDDDKQFILVQLDESLEKILEKSDNDSKERAQTSLDFAAKNNLPKKLSSITYERLNRIMNGVSNTGNNQFKWLKKNLPYENSLDVYEIVQLSVYNENIFKQVDELDYGQSKFNNIKDKIEWVCNNFEKVARKLKNANNS
jgi:adenine-specific DNA-methyltransferase